MLSENGVAAGAYRAPSGALHPALRAPCVPPEERPLSPSRCKSLKTMATPGGLQPPTSALGKPCSMQLSYGANTLT